MLRQTSNEVQILDRTAEVAATIAEEGLGYVSDSAPGHTLKRSSHCQSSGSLSHRLRSLQLRFAPIGIPEIRDL